MTQSYETQDILAATTQSVGYVWRCHRCGRYLGTIERVDGALEIRHHCGAVNLLRGVLTGGIVSGGTVDRVSEPE